LNSSEREDIQTMDSRFFGLLFCGAMERKTGLSKWRILSRIVAAQFCRFRLATLSYDYFRFVSWLDRPTFCQQLQIEQLGILKSWQSRVEPKAAHLVLV